MGRARELLEAEARGRGRLEEALGGAGPVGREELCSELRQKGEATGSSEPVIRVELGSELRGKREAAGAAGAGAGAEAEGEPDGVALRGPREGAIRFREEGCREGACCWCRGKEGFC